MSINQRLNFLLERYSKGNVLAFSKRIGVSHTTIATLLPGSRESKPGFEIIAKILDEFKEVSAEWLIRGEEPILRKSNPEPEAPALSIASEEKTEYTPRLVNGKFQPSKIEIHAITLDSNNKENIHLVSTKAAAGYKTRSIYQKSGFFRT